MFFLTILGCSVDNQAVYFGEMPSSPELSLNGNLLKIKTANSGKNSALLTYKVSVLVYHTKKEVYLSAKQALGKKYKETFTIDLRDHQITDPSTYSYYWLDPDKKTTQLDIKIE